MLKRLFQIFILLIISLLGFSQKPIADSIAPKKTIIGPARPIDSTFVSYTNFHLDSISLNASRVIDTSTFDAPIFDPLEKANLLYSTLSNTGLAHKPMRFSNIRRTGFDMSLPAYSAYLQDEHSMVSYQSVLPYSEVRYVMTTGDKEQHLNFRFGRQFMRRLFVSFAINSDYSPGIFKNNQSENNYFWLNLNYHTENQRYAILAYAYRNKLEMKENGGITDDEAYTSHAETDNSVLITNLTDASTYIRATGMGLEHYFNLLPMTVQKKAINEQPMPIHPDTLSVDSPIFIANDPLLFDSLYRTSNDTISIDSLKAAHNRNTDSLPEVFTVKTRKFTLGRICHSFDVQRTRMYYNEASPYVAFYLPYDTLFDAMKTTDTTIVQSIRNTLKWNTLGYHKYNDDVPFYLYAGLTHGMYRLKRYDYTEEERITVRDYQQLSVNGGIIINLFKSTRITGHGELVTLGYQIGDFDVRGQWKQFLGTTRRNLGALIFDADIKRQSASWFEESYYSNHFRWDNDFRASTYLTFDLRYKYRDYCIGVKQTSIAQYIYFGTDAYPTQYDGMFSIREAYMSFRQTLKRFDFSGFACIQKASNEDVMHLPLVTAKLRFAYSQPIFKKQATIQPILTISYFTPYFADAFMPATRSFYLQNQVKIGNYPFIDLAMALKVKKANLFVAYSNMFQLVGNYNGFIGTHYPMRDKKFFFGINWRLFN